MNILVSIRKGNTADAYFRARAPWSVCRLFTNHEIIVEPATTDLVAWSDVVIFQRSTSPEEELLVREAKSLGKKVIYDVDDNLFDIPPSCPELYPWYWQPGKLKMNDRLVFHARMLKAADMVTVPTAELGVLLREQLGPDLPIKVVPNMILRGDWDALTPMQSKPEGSDADTVLVGWMGYTYHWDDWFDLRHALDKVFAERNARLVIMGFPEVTRAFSDRLRAKTITEPILPFVEFDRMRQMMMTLDLAILPLCDSRFNRGKSPLKALQFGMAGVPIVASTVVYGALRYEHSDLPMILCDPDPAAWADTLALAIDNARSEHMKHMASDWREQVEASHCLESPRGDRPLPKATLWIDACEEVANA